MREIIDTFLCNLHHFKNCPPELLFHSFINRGVTCILWNAPVIKWGSLSPSAQLSFPIFSNSHFDQPWPCRKPFSSWTASVLGPVRCCPSSRVSCVRRLLFHLTWGLVVPDPTASCITPSRRLLTLSHLPPQDHRWALERVLFHSPIEHMVWLFFPSVLPSSLRQTHCVFPTLVTLPTSTPLQFTHRRVLYLIHRHPLLTHIYHFPQRLKIYTDELFKQFLYP